MFQREVLLYFLWTFLFSGVFYYSIVKRVSRKRSKYVHGVLALVFSLIHLVIQVKLFFETLTFKMNAPFVATLWAVLYFIPTIGFLLAVWFLFKRIRKKGNGLKML